MDVIATQKMLAAQVSSQQESPGRLCPECYLSISEGSDHKCAPSALPSIEMIDSASGKSEEEQAANLVRKKLVSESSTKSGKEYGRLTLATGARPIHLEVKRPKIEPEPTATSEDLVQHMQKQNFSFNQIKKEQKFVRKIFGTKSVEAHSHKKVVEATHHLDNFFEVKTMEFTEKVGKSEFKKVEKPVVVVKDANALFQYLHEKMDLDGGHTTVQNGIPPPHEMPG